MNPVFPSPSCGSLLASDSLTALLAGRRQVCHVCWPQIKPIIGGVLLLTPIPGPFFLLFSEVPPSVS